MDSLITAAGRALASGDPIGALKRVSLRDDAPALALRGIAMAQLGDLARARVLLRRAARAFSPKEAVARARCVVAETEIALAFRDLSWPTKRLDLACATLEAHGDRLNAAHARYLEVRRLLLINRIDEAERMLAHLDPRNLPPALKVVHELVTAGLALRRLQTKTGRDAITRAGLAAHQAGIPALMAEVENASRLLNTPAARLISGGAVRMLRLEDVEALQRSNALVVDACRFAVRSAGNAVSLAGRPVLFELARVLAEAWPGDASRDRLLERAFGAKLTDGSHRARLRVEIGRLRRLLRTVATVTATKSGFLLTPSQAPEVVVLARPVEHEHGALLALLTDGEAWSTSSLALALGTSQRTVQRALDSLASDGKVQAFGRARARRWLTPSVPGFTTTLLLPALLPSV